MREPLVLVPGTLCDESLFDDVVAELPDREVQVTGLAEHRRVVDAARAVLDKAPAFFVCAGFSLGGFVALEMLRRAPDRVLGVALVAGNAHPDMPENADRRRSDVMLSRQIGMTDFVRRRAPDWGVDGDLAIVGRITAMAVACGQDAHERHAEMNITRPDLREVARTSRRPIVVLAGCRDRLCPRTRYEAAAAGPNGSLRLINDAGHYLPLESPRQVAAALRQMETST